MDFTWNGLSFANDNDKKINEFFQNMKVWIREYNLKKELKFKNQIDLYLNEYIIK